MRPFNPAAYGPVFQALLTIDRRRPLELGHPSQIRKPELEALSQKQALAHLAEPPADSNMADCCLAGVWLLHDCLDQSHSVSQRIDTPTGAFWHGIMHRREGDFGNAKYWFRQTGSHPVFDTLGQHAIELAAIQGNEAAIKSLTTAGAWEPFAFVDLCKAAVRGESDTLDLCLDIQQTEWELLFDYCYCSAIK